MGLLAYNSVKFIRVDHPLLVFIYYSLLLAVLTYVIAYMIVVQKGYQEYDTLVGSTMIKTKGVAFYDTSSSTGFFEMSPASPSLASLWETTEKSILPPVLLQEKESVKSKSVSDNFLEQTTSTAAPSAAPSGAPSATPAPEIFDPSHVQFYDANDLVIPPFVPGGFFVTSTLVETPAQSRGVCPGNDKKAELCNCSSKSNVNCCQAGTTTSNGVKMGTCSPGGQFCDISGWCPLEDESKFRTLNHVANWTVMIRINANFPRFHQQLSNTGKSELELGVNLFRIEDLINKAGFTFDSVKAKGALILVSFKYDCDLNKDINQCQPVITASRLDQNSSLSTGFNYRFISKYHVNGLEYRDLSKVYGFRVIVSVEGRGGKFSLGVLSTTIGAGLALLGVAALVSDFVMQYLLPDKQKLVSKKYEEVSDNLDDGKLLTTDTHDS
jgi:hypothetical protein